MDNLTLLGYLARFGTFTTQSEVLCTQGLAYLLDTHQQARAALATEVHARTAVSCEAPLKWIPERAQVDGGKPDLEAQTTDGVPVVKIEAKLGAQLLPGQLQSYSNDLLDRNKEQSALLVLVPSGRSNEVNRIAMAAFSLSGAGPWPPTADRRIGIAIITWDELFTVLSSVAKDRFGYELEQLQEMYRVLSGDYIAPLADYEALRQWREHGRETDLVNIIDRVTRQLNRQPRVPPMQAELLEDVSSREDEPSFYRYRYVRVWSGNPKSYFSIGVRDSFAEWVTPIWLRFHKNTGNFSQIRQRIQASPLRWLESGGNIWIPLELPLQAQAEQMVESLVKQAEDVEQAVA